ncbi:unnamed protein product [Oppiella nova]|uniref:Protein kinase domain-containing protein n=1 Tax=Oppiella nova TaxID=334625 RepID=A0A7R9MCB4_9ACAR|nr:unnamed protein product [Oppiella nova]CAG2174599.1 unnamed protein product [Oppiella nova]
MDVLDWITTSPYNHHNWGYNIWGQLGRGVTPEEDYSKPKRISYFDDKDVQQISCGFQHSLALTSSGQVYGWGRNWEGQIGLGGFGTVLRVKHKSHGQVYAVKRIQINDFDEKEVQNLVNVRSEYVVRYYHSWREPDFGYIQMELCSHSLKNILELKAQVFERQSGDPMDCIEYFISCEIFRQILEAVQYLHELDPKIIHRDLKPDNILIDTNAGNDRFVKLCDFGLATVHDKRIHYRTTQKHTADVGDLHYIAPEVSQGKKYNQKCDVYAVGLIGGKLFDINVEEIDQDNPKDYSTTHTVLNAPVLQLQTILDSMDCGIKWHKRPDCRQVLGKYKDWSVDCNIVVTDPVCVKDYQLFGHPFIAVFVSAANFSAEHRMSYTGHRFFCDYKHCTKHYSLWGALREHMSTGNHVSGQPFQC